MLKLSLLCARYQLPDVSACARRGTEVERAGAEGVSRRAATAAMSAAFPRSRFVLTAAAAATALKLGRSGVERALLEEEDGAANIAATRWDFADRDGRRMGLDSFRENLTRVRRIQNQRKYIHWWHVLGSSLQLPRKTHSESVLTIHGADSGVSESMC